MITDSTNPDVSPLTESLLARFGLTGLQATAARERRRDVAVTAGAGSGKTRTLVARYLPLLAECRAPRRIVAITFTEKAAREMRNRIRGEVRRLIIEAVDEQQRRLWLELEGRLDSARISTIHSLCQEVLRAHPVEAGLDPQFAVLDENQSALLRAEAVRAALTAAVDDPRFQPLLGLWKTATLDAALNRLVDGRLEADDLLQAGCDPQQFVGRELERWLAGHAAQSALDDLRAARASGELGRAANAGDKLASMAIELLSCLEQAAADLAAGQAYPAALALFTARRQHMRGNIGKAGPLKELVKELKEDYDAGLGWLGGSSASDETPMPAVEARISQSYPLLFALYARARDSYLAALRRANAVDFNDLEGKTHELLKQSAIAARWQAEIDWVLVDEFQDTNGRQREIVQDLCGPAGNKLFVVGDARQSIYRFRGADVTVFCSLQDKIKQAGGLMVNLEHTFRTHDGLLTALGDLLEPLMNQAELARWPFHVPYSPLCAERPNPGAHLCAPHVEWVLAGGPDSARARQAAALALARRLLALKAEGQIQHWGQVTLLFRASTSFQAYEDALEACGIPYITVAGRGFYDRPEIRDLLNLLRALADPWDDLALAGLLHSPAFGLSLHGLTRLRFAGEERNALYQALQAELSMLSEADQAAAERVRAFLTELLPLVDRIPVADLLQRVVDWTDYRAILAAGAHRLWRNLDKLLGDARASGTLQVQAFLEYLGMLKDVGAREGEAAAEAEGAARLMTIHKSKGLEFEFVVLADASRAATNHSEAFYLLPGLGLAFKPDRMEGEPLAYRYAKTLDQAQAEAEDCRLLYVALTRAKDKLLVSGHFTLKKEKASAAGWMKELLEVVGFDLDRALLEPTPQHTLALPCGQPLAIYLHPDGAQDELLYRPLASPPARPTSQAVGEPRPLFNPLTQVEDTPAEVSQPDQASWRATGQDNQLLGLAIGQMVHKAIQRWRFPGAPGLDALLDRMAREHGVVEESQRQYALAEAARLLARFQTHPFWLAIDRAALRRHEVPYVVQRDGQAEVGYIDLLFREHEGAGWSLVDFKTDTIQSEAELQRLSERYTAQARRYTRAVRALLGPVDVKWLTKFGHKKGQK